MGTKDDIVFNLSSSTVEKEPIDFRHIDKFIISMAIVYILAKIATY